MSSVRFGDLTSDEIRLRARDGCIAIVPTGCTEQQGPHLPVDFDTWFAERLTVAAAERAEQHGIHAVVLPAMPFGPTPEHRGYGSGYIDVPVEVHEQVVQAVLVSLMEQGFQRIVIWRGCGGHDLRDVVQRFNATAHDGTPVWLPDPPYHAIWCRLADPSVPAGHADSFTTSICLYLRPDAVRTDKIAVSTDQTPVNWDDPDLDFSRSSPSGVIGDPTHASAELGAALWDACVDAVVEVLGNM